MVDTNGDTAVAPHSRSTTSTRKKVASKTKPPGKKRIAEIDASQFMVKPTIMEVTLEGLTPLLVHNFGAKAIREILEKQMGKAKPKRDHKDPFQDFIESLYIIDQDKVPKEPLEPGGHWKYFPDTFGFPANAFKKAMVNACSFVEGIPKTRIRGVVHVHGDILPLKYSKLVLRQDTVRIGKWNSKTSDIRFRGEFHDWSVKLRLQYNSNAITPEQLAMLINNAGFSVGLGEWRPEKDGSHGTFAIA